MKLRASAESRVIPLDQVVTAVRSTIDLLSQV